MKGSLADLKKELAFPFYGNFFENAQRPAYIILIGIFYYLSREKFIDFTLWCVILRPYEYLYFRLWDAR
jgi:hypothetical protein